MLIDDCVFCKIIRKELKSEKVYEDEDMLIIKDINPEAKLHYLLLPKDHFANIAEMSEEQAIKLGKCLKKLGELADSLGLKDGFRIISNKGENSGQSIEHLHIHILGGEKLPLKLV